MDPVDNFGLSGYASMMNNPISYIDPDGRNPAVIGAAIGAVSYTLQTAFSKGGFKNWDWMKFGISTISGAVFGGISAGIGESVSAITNSGLRFAVQTGAHSVMGGFNSALNGGSFKSGLISGGVGSVWGSFTDRLGAIGQIGGSALFSGISSELSGGNFWQGAAIGGITTGLNHYSHTIYERIAQNAEKYIGSTDWAYDVEKDNFGIGWKCNKFCFDVLNESGIPPSIVSENIPAGVDIGYFDKMRPPTAGEWGNPSKKINNWKVVKSPRRGDIAAYSHSFTDATGHVGIYTGGGKGVWANQTVIRYDNINNKVWNTNNTIIYRRYQPK